MTDAATLTALPSVRPQLLPPNQFERFYRGGAGIEAFRGAGAGGEYMPEDWIGSTTKAYGEETIGLSRLNGRTLRDEVESDPEAYLGPEHVARWGSDTRLLVKLLDPAERLPIHLHPDDEAAARLLGAHCGKTEAWIFLDAKPGTIVRVGFAREVSLEELSRWYEEQAIDELLDAMYPLEVTGGDALFVPAGIPHAIAADVFILELQQPSDLSLMLEWKGVALGGADPLLGIPRDQALPAIRRTAMSARELERLASRRGKRLFPEEGDAFFRAEQVSANQQLERGFSILVVLEGAGTLETAERGSLQVSRGDAALVPYAAGAFHLTGSLSGLLCRPPAA